MLRMIDSPFGKVAVHLLVRYVSSLGKDDLWRRTVEVTSARQDTFPNNPILPCLVGGSPVKFQYLYQVNAKGSPCAGTEGYWAQRQEGGYCCFLGNGQEVGSYLREPLEIWIRAFLKDYLGVANGQGAPRWAEAEHEGRVNAYQELDRRAEALRKQLNEAHALANAMFADAQEWEQRKNTLAVSADQRAQLREDFFTRDGTTFPPTYTPRPGKEDACAAAWQETLVCPACHCATLDNGTCWHCGTTPRKDTK